VPLRNYTLTLTHSSFKTDLQGKIIEDLVLKQLQLTSVFDTFVLRWIDTYRTHSGASSAKSLAIVPDCVEMRQSAIAVAENIQTRTVTMLPNV